MNGYRYALVVAAAAGLWLTQGAAPAIGAEFDLRYSDIGPPRGPRAEATKWWADQIEKRSHGRVKFEFFWSQSLVKGKDNLKATGAGLTETGLIIGVYTPADLPIWNVANTPFMFTDAWVGMRTMFEARQEIPALRKEAAKKNVKILCNNTTGPVQLLSAKVPMRTVADLQGKKIRTTGGWTQLFKALGAVPVSIGFGELYSALDRGTIDATINYTPFVVSYKHYEVAKYLTEANMGQLLGYGIGINLDLWKRMPKDIQDIIAKTSDEYMDHYAQLYIEDSIKARKELEAGIDGKVVQVFELSDAERDKWAAAAEPIINGWLADMKRRGDDGPGILATIKRIQAKYRKEKAEKGYPWQR